MKQNLKTKKPTYPINAPCALCGNINKPKFFGVEMCAEQGMHKQFHNPQQFYFCDINCTHAFIKKAQDMEWRGPIPTKGFL